MAGNHWRMFAGAAILALAVVPAQAQQFSDGYTFLKAVKERDGDKVEALIAEPGSIVVNIKEQGTGNGAIHIVARERDLTWLTYLLNKGARPDLQNKEGNTALALAAQIGWVDGATMLLRKKASVNLGNSRGETPLIHAVHNRDMAMVRLLLSYGADPRKTDSAAGYSALDYSKQDGRSPALIKLLETPVEAEKPVAGPKL